MDEISGSTETRFVVLLVDDQMILVDAVRRLLENNDKVDFHYCADPLEAVAHAELLRPTVILQDLVIPGADGLDLIRNYRRSSILSEVPVIGLSTQKDSIVKERLFEMGGNAFLIKLPDALEFNARINYHSKSYLVSLQRDDAYRALRISQQQLLDTVLVLQRTNAKLEALTNSDALTGLANRRHFDSFIKHEWENPFRTQKIYSY